ncbi:MAG: N-acetyltransferase [Geobacter sp.]|nr:MAG: N-acetyltransferase [Geobacter sp.]
MEIMCDFDYPAMINKVVHLQHERRSANLKDGVPLAIRLRPVADSDLEFLCQLYASTRDEEKKLVGWDDAQWESFMRMQFNLQHTHYMRNYQNPTFDIIMHGHAPIGRLYIDHGAKEMRVIDICLMPEYRGRGIGSVLMRQILQEGDDSGVPVTLHVERNNPALALYQRLGFQVVYSAEVYCFMKSQPKA